MAISDSPQHWLRMSLIMIKFECLPFKRSRKSSGINRHGADFFFRRSSTSRDAMERFREIYDAASVRSGNTSLLVLNDSENVGYLRSTLRRLHARWRRLTGYRFGMHICAGSAGTAVLINLTLTIWAWKSFGVHDGFGTIQHGQCARTRKLSLWFHFAINVFGTALLSASNYIMQCLSFSTRQDIDKAHARNQWLDIGVPSIRNLRRITRNRIVLWWLLAFSSLPLHLMYNSAVFDTLSIHTYAVYVVSQDFITGAPFSFEGHSDYYSSGSTDSLHGGFPDPPKQYYTEQLEKLRSSNSGIKTKKLTAKNCILTYGNVFGNSKYKDVLAVSRTRSTNSLLYFHGGGIWENATASTDLWFCEFHKADHGSCNVAEAASDAQDLMVDTYPIDYCFAQEVDEKCMLQFSLPIMLIVIICNLIKLACMIYVVLKKTSQPLMIVEDAIASFLNESDIITNNICLTDTFFSKKNLASSKIDMKVRTSSVGSGCKHDTMVRQ